VSDGSFRGFGHDLPHFFDGLEADNSKAYWSDHRELYEQQVRGPLAALLADLAPEFGDGKVFRPYRDVRFSHDKSPYKTQAAGHTHGRDGSSSLYLHVDAEGLFVAGGYWRMERDQVARYRAAVADETTGEALVRVVRSLERDGWSRAGDQLSRAPRGYPADHPRIDLLRHKGLAVSRSWDAEPWLFTPEALDVVAEHWRAVAPLGRWLHRHVGPHVPDATDRDEAARR
jgi:uncharacterized protein (TIGR02453 family)